MSRHTWIDNGLEVTAGHDRHGFKGKFFVQVYNPDTDDYIVNMLSGCSLGDVFDILIEHNLQIPGELEWRLEEDEFQARFNNNVNITSYCSYVPTFEPEGS